VVGDTAADAVVDDDAAAGAVVGDAAGAGAGAVGAEDEEAWNAEWAGSDVGLVDSGDEPAGEGEDYDVAQEKYDTVGFVAD
jgi:hypothetical protein